MGQIPTGPKIRKLPPLTQECGTCRVRLDGAPFVSGCLIRDCPFPEVENHDPVNHPKHYTNHPSGIECIQITRHMGFNLGNAMKYIWRADLKNGVEDLKKAAWYIEDEIKKREGKT